MLDSNDAIQCNQDISHRQSLSKWPPKPQEKHPGVPQFGRTLQFPGKSWEIPMPRPHFQRGPCIYLSEVLPRHWRASVSPNDSSVQPELAAFDLRLV